MVSTHIGNLKKINIYGDLDDASLQALGFFKEVSMHNPEQVADAIAALQTLQQTMTELLGEHPTALEPVEADYMLSLYAKHLGLLQQHEGRNFDTAHTSYRMCLRIFQFIMAALYDFPNEYMGTQDIPQEIRELV